MLEPDQRDPAVAPRQAQVQDPQNYPVVGPRTIPEIVMPISHEHVALVAGWTLRLYDGPETLTRRPVKERERRERK